MINTDRQVLSAIQRNPYPQDACLTELAGVVTSLLREVEALKARLAVAEAYARSGCPCEVKP